MASTDQGLAELILPARDAAKKASESFAEQLTDSAGRSDADSPSPTNPFREPTQRTKAVKYRYTATGKHLSSPLKGSSSSPDRKPNKPKKSKLTSLTPAPSSHAAGKGKAPAVATTPRKRKASNPSVRKEDMLNAMFLSSPSPLSSPPSSPLLSTKDLPPPFHTIPAEQPVPGPPKQLPVSKTFSLQSLQPTKSDLSVFSQPLSTKRKQKKGKTNTQKNADAWDIGNSVWVLVNQSGVPVGNTVTHPQTSDPLMWWPARVVQRQPLRVTMFGESLSSSSASRGLCTIFSPSSSNIQSINDDSGAKRFSRATFRLTCVSVADDAGPPIKKPRLDDNDEGESTEARWESAVQSMDKASTLEKEGLPALLSSYATAGGTFYDSLDDSDPDASDLRRPLSKSTSSASKKPKPIGSTRKLKAQRSRILKDENGTTPLRYSPCPPDPTLQIPGELIFALAPRTGGSFWPAQILEHVPDRKEKYNVKFLDDKEHVITRDRFFTSDEEGFVLCTLGKWESAIKITDDAESGDEGGYDADANAQDQDESALPPPPPAKDFEDLSLRLQLAYVKPVLRAILNKEYVPARKNHETFMKGGSGRVALLKSAGVRGGLDARFVKAVQKTICKWVLGDTGLKPERLDTGDILTGGSEVTPIVEAPFAEPAPEEALPGGSMQDDKMEGIEDTTVPEYSHTDKSDGITNGTLPLTTLYKQVDVAQASKMAVDGHEQSMMALPPPAHAVALSPVIRPPKSQLDLLAEVSQAVATEPSLLPSHPELPKLKVHLLEKPSKDTSSQPSPLTPIPEEDRPVPARECVVACEEFDALSGVEKLDYCLNILLPECIQQLILWRSGERSSSALLSPEEEQRLHDVAARKAAETDWVDDVMRLRAAQARLRGIDLTKKAEPVEIGGPGTRSRPRRATISRP